MRNNIRTAWILAFFLCLPCVFYAAGRVPRDTGPLIDKKYAGWSGVLRIWACEELPLDGIPGWINRCAQSFEKAHPGVYIEVRTVPGDAVVLREESGVRPPDMILFPPGLLRDGSGLAPLDVSARSNLTDSACALPVAAGGYLWALNSDGASVELPPDEPFVRRSAAAEHIGSPEAYMGETPLPGVDLGLPAMNAFLSGEAGRFLATQKELAKLERLSAQGREPEWEARPGAGAYTDQLCLLGVAAQGGERQELSEAFAAHLLTEECQAMLSGVGACPVTDAAGQWAPGSAMAVLDAQLRREDLVTAKAFCG